MKTTRILALNLGLDIGWAIRADDGAVMYGNDDVGTRRTHNYLLFWEFRMWLARISRKAEIEIVYKESSSSIHRSWFPHLSEYCERTGTSLRGVSGGAIRKFVTGRGNASEDAVLEALGALGFQTSDDGQEGGYLSQIGGSRPRTLGCVPVPATAIALLLFAENEQSRKGKAA